MPARYVRWARPHTTITIVTRVRSLQTVGISIEQGETERTNASSLLAFLHESRVLHQQDIVSAFRENVEFLTDIICDVPFAAEYFGTMYGDLIAKVRVFDTTVVVPGGPSADRLLDR